MHAYQQVKDRQRITEPSVKQLLSLVSCIGMTSAGSDTKKSHLLTELKSSIVYYGCPIIFLTINPGDRHSPLALAYSGNLIDLKHFRSSDYSATDRLFTILRHPLAVVEYFHNTVHTIIKSVLKGGLSENSFIIMAQLNIRAGGLLIFTWP